MEVLWWRGCPSWERTVELVRAEMIAAGLDPEELSVVEMRTDADAQQADFVGSPTVRVNGTDVTPPGQQPAAGEQAEPPLVNKLQELKMIRSLQMRINQRTQRYGQMIEGEQAETPELQAALEDLAERQQRVYKATSDLSQGRND